METTSSKTNWSNILLLIINLCAFLFFAFGAVLLFTTTLFSSLVTLPDGTGTPPATILFGSALCLCAVFLFPGVLFSLRRIQNKPVPAMAIHLPKAWQIILLILFWVGNILLADFLNAQFTYGWLAAVPSFLLAVAIPVIVLVWIGTRGLPLGSGLRTWSSLSIGMSISPLLATVLEFIMGLVLLIIGTFSLLLHPDWANAALRLSSRLQNVSGLDGILQTLAPVLTSPTAIAIMFLVMSFFIPLIEEAVKPMAVWVGGGKCHTPAEGFAMGLLCGAGFALVEGLISASSPSDGWGALMAGRAGGSLMHITTSALMGWAIVSSRQGKHKRLLVTYLACVIFHGMWNAAAVLGILATLKEYLSPVGATPLFIPLALAAGGILIVIIPTMLTILISANRRLQMVPLSSSDIIPPPSYTSQD
jgi:hypothetical protein